MIHLNNIKSMTLKYHILAAAALLLAVSCVKENLQEPGRPGDGEVRIAFAAQTPDEVYTKAGDGDSRIENALVFVFNPSDGSCLAKQWSYIEDDKTMYMYLPSGQVSLYAVCNLLDPETMMNSVNSLSDLQDEEVTIQDWTGAYKGKYIMSGSLTTQKVEGETIVIPVERIAAQFNVTLKFEPVITQGHQFMVSEVSLHNIPSGTWILPRSGSARPALEERSGAGDDIETSHNFVLESTGSRDDWTYSEVKEDMAARYFQSATLTLDGDISSTEGASVSFSIFENRRGVLDTGISTPPALNDPYAVNWPLIYNRLDSEKALYAQLWKKGLHDNVCLKDHAQHFGMDCATYMTIKGVYIMGDQKHETEYFVYLGNDNFSSFDVDRNHRYTMDVVIRTIDQADTRVNSEEIGGIKFYYDSEMTLDSHCNAVQTLLYSTHGWEVWVENPDRTPWLELSTTSDYKPQFLGSPAASENAGFRITGEGGLRYVYVHTDEFVPDLGSPEENNKVPVREGTICYREQGSSDISRCTVKQYPAQMVILYIEHDVNNLMQEVRDTFYVERILEKRHLEWGFTTYWNFEIDELISKGQWDGLKDTRTLYDAALVGGKYGIGPAYQESETIFGENRIPNNVALRYVLDKNRDRNGNGYIDRDEIMWFMPAINELEALYEARDQWLVEFEGDDDYFFSSSPSSADPNGITTGYAYYIKMGNGKTGLAQRDNEYNVIACRRTNAWKGPDTASGSGTVSKDESWDNEEVIMPKK